MDLRAAPHGAADSQVAPRPAEPNTASAAHQMRDPRACGPARRLQRAQLWAILGEGECARGLGGAEPVARLARPCRCWPCAVSGAQRPRAELLQCTRCTNMPLH